MIGLHCLSETFWRVDRSRAVLFMRLFQQSWRQRALNGDWLLDHYGPLKVAKVSALSATFGIVLFAMSTDVVFAFVGALFAGLGTAIFYPLTMSAAARRPGDAEDNVAAMSLFAFTSFMLAPPILGGIADLVGLRVALLVIAPLAASSYLLSNELKKDVKKKPY